MRGIILFAKLFILVTSVISFISCSKDDPIEGINNEQEEVFEKISVLNLPEKILYALDEPLDLNGLVVEGITKDNKKFPLRIKKEHITGFNSGKATNNLLLTITFKKLTTTFTVKVLSIRVEDGVLTKNEGDIT